MRRRAVAPRRRSRMLRSPLPFLGPASIRRCSRRRRRRPAGGRTSRSSSMKAARPRRAAAPAAAPRRARAARRDRCVPRAYERQVRERVRRSVRGAVERHPQSRQRLLQPRGRALSRRRDAAVRGARLRPRDHLRGVQLLAVAGGGLRQADRATGAISTAPGRTWSGSSSRRSPISRPTWRTRIASRRRTRPRATRPPVTRRS